ncbi:MAG TPA: hypothetical protein EYP43_00005, partial [Thermoplasmata archaeon]|nr:hypothetical protein [Thermoplasmata archaeon]
MTTMQGNAKGYRVAVGDFDNNGYMDIAGGFGTDDVAGYPGSIKVWRESSTPSDLGVTLLFPDGGEMFKQGSAWFVRWTSTVPSTATGVEIDLEYSTEGDDGPWTSIASGLPNSGIYQWKVPDEESDDCYLRITISDAQGNSASDINDAPFGIGRTPGGGGGREPHDPIQINSDAEWTPANGVRRGTGTETDPYIIERWDIRGDDSTCISITNTRAYAVIRDCHLHNTTGLRQGIYLKNAENITIEDNDIDHTHHGVNTKSAEYRLLDNRIVDIEARGVMVGGGDNRITAIGNTLRNTGVYGFNLDGGGGVTHQGYWKYPALLENNTISGAVYGIYLNTATGTFRRNRVFGCGYGVHCTIGMTWDRAVNATFVDNVFTHNQFGAYVALLREDVDGHPYWAILRDNRFERNTFRGLWLSAGAEYTVENNTFALNPLGIDSLASGVQTFRNNTVMYNLGGIYLREKYGPGASDGITIEDNDILNNAYFGVRNDDAHAPGRVAGNYLGGTPGDDGDRLEGPIVGTFASTPNDPDTPDVAGNVTVIDAGTSVVIDSDTTLRCHYFVRKGGGLTIRGATVDIDGMWIAAKIGARLNITSSTLLDGLTVAVSTDLAEIVNSTFDGLVAGISVYRASPEINNCTVRNENGSYQPGAHSSKTKVVLEPAGIYLNGGTARIRGGRIETGGAFGVFAIGSTARIEDLTVLGNAWGVAARSGNLSLVDCGIRSCSQAGITNYDGWWHYGNLSITIDGCRLDDNEIGIELPVGEVGGTGTPHDIRIVDTTVSGGTTGLALEVDGAEIICSTFDRNGLIIDGSDLLFSGNTVSGGYGLVLHGYGLHLDNNTFNSNSRGLQVRDSSPIVVNNDFTQNRYGVYAEDKAQPKLRYNNFENNLDYGVYNDDSSTLINATLNWWNSATGPGGEGNGSGDAVSKYVAFTPWLLSESDHNGHYENVPPDPPTVSLPSTAALWFRLRGATQDPEGDIIRSVEVRVRNDTFDTGWLPANASWRDVRSRGRYAHIVDALGLAGRYEVSVRCHDGNDPSPVVTRDITVNVTSFEEHAPIVIVGDAGFTAANGVRSGSGTATDPYIIEGWDISSNDSASISISNTTAHVVIRLCHIHGNRSNDGIAVAHSRNVRIERCRLVDNDHGITVYQEGRVEIEGCLINGSGSADVYTRDSLVNVTGSAFWNGRYSLDMAGGPEIPLTVARSTFVGGALYLIDLNVTVRDCLMTGGQVIGGSVGGEGEYLFNITGNVM